MTFCPSLRTFNLSTPKRLLSWDTNDRKNRLLRSAYQIFEGHLYRPKMRPRSFLTLADILPSVHSMVLPNGRPILGVLPVQVHFSRAGVPSQVRHLRLLPTSSTTFRPEPPCCRPHPTTLLTSCERKQLETKRSGSATGEALDICKLTAMTTQTLQSELLFDHATTTSRTALTPQSS